MMMGNVLEHKIITKCPLEYCYIYTLVPPFEMDYSDRMCFYDINCIAAHLFLFCFVLQVVGWCKSSVADELFSTYSGI